MMMGDERWRRVPGFSDYEVSDWGRLKSWRAPGNSRRPRAEPMMMHLIKHKCGLFFVTLSPGRKQKWVAALVLAAFVRPRPTPDHKAHRLNGIKRDNRLENLEWTLQPKVMHDTARLGLMPTGERARYAKLTSGQVTYIRARAAAGTATPTELAEQFGVSRGSVIDIVNGRNWRHIPFNEIG